MTDSKTAPPPRPRPIVNEDNAFFWDGIADGELRIQTCAGCGAKYHPPVPSCRACGGYDMAYDVASGRGTIYSYVTFYYPKIPGFTQPYIIGLIELEEGTRIVTNVLDVDPAEVRIGMPVQLDFVTGEDELTLPQFRVVQA